MAELLRGHAEARPDGPALTDERGVTTWSELDGRSLLVGPVYHSAQWLFSHMLLNAGRAVVMRRSFDAAETLRLIDEHAITLTRAQDRRRTVTADGGPSGPSGPSSRSPCQTIVGGETWRRGRVVLPWPDGAPVRR